MQTYTVDIAGEPVTLPIVPINQKLAISLLMVIDMGVRFGERIGKAMAARLGPLKPDIIVGAATLGIPVFIEVSRALRLDQYVIAQKAPKIHLADGLVQELEFGDVGRQAAPDARPARGAAARRAARRSGRRRGGDRFQPGGDNCFGARSRRAGRRPRRDSESKATTGRRRSAPTPASSKASGTSRNSRSPTAGLPRCRTRID
jgi:hypothetical protein